MHPLPRVLSSQDHHFRLPPEVTDIIIDHLHADPPSLALCGLICKSWVAASRYHLFRAAVISSDNATAFSELLDSQYASFAVYVEELLLTIENLALESAHQWLALLISVKTLTLRDMSMMNLACGDPLSNFTSAFANVIHLELFYVVFHDRDFFLRFICAFPLLRNLSAISSEPLTLEGPHPNPSASAPLSALRSLVVSEIGEWFITWLHMLNSVPSLHILELRDWDMRPDLYVVVAILLKRLGPKLRHLVLPEDVLVPQGISDSQYLDLSHNLELEGLRCINIHHPNVFIQRLPSLLASSDTICFRSLHFEVDYTEHYSPKEAEWSELADILAGMFHHRELRCIEFSWHCDLKREDVERSQAIVKRNLLACESILRFSIH